MRLFVIIAAILGLYAVGRLIAMRMKHGVSLEGVNWRMFYAAIVSEAVFNRFGYDLVITAGTDGTHKSGSLHYQGLALDLRTWGVTNTTELAQALRDALGPNYDVVIESTHIHIEYDPN